MRAKASQKDSCERATRAKRAERRARAESSGENGLLACAHALVARADSSSGSGSSGSSSGMGLLTQPAARGLCKSMARARTHDEEFKRAARRAAATLRRSNTSKNCYVAEINQDNKANRRAARVGQKMAFIMRTRAFACVAAIQREARGDQRGV